jgi:DNA-binding winged helix-turn-helix (wHTH) protein
MPASDEIITCGLRLSLHEHLVRVGGHPVDLTRREFEILMQMSSHPGWVFSSDQLADGDESAPDFSPYSVSVHVSRLRRKLALGGAPNVIVTVRGVGYRLRTEADPSCPDWLTSEDAPEAGGRVAPHHPLADSIWELEEAVMALEHQGSEEQLAAARAELEETRRAIEELLGR